MKDEKENGFFSWLGSKIKKNKEKIEKKNDCVSSHTSANKDKKYIDANKKINIKQNIFTEKQDITDVKIEQISDNYDNLDKIQNKK